MPYGAGLVFVLAWGFALPFSLAFGLVETQAATSYGMALFAVCLVGFLDDLAGTGEVKGIKGHFSEALEGRISSGALKALFIILVSFIAVSGKSGSLVDLWRNAAIVALCANAFNALDVCPGRALKVYWGASCLTLSGLGLAANSGNVGGGMVLTLPILASTAVYGLDDLGERLMMGDAGANAIGISLGQLLICIPEAQLRTMVLVALSLFQVLIETHSVSRLVERSEILRWLDALGRIKAAAENTSKRNLSRQRE